MSRTQSASGQSAYATLGQFPESRLSGKWQRAFHQHEITTRITTRRLDRTFQLEYRLQRQKLVGAGRHEQLCCGSSLAAGAIPWTGFGRLWQARAAGLCGPAGRPENAKAASGIRGKPWQCGGLPPRSDGGGSVLGRPLAVLSRSLEIGVRLRQIKEGSYGPKRRCPSG